MRNSFSEKGFTLPVGPGCSNQHEVHPVEVFFWYTSIGTANVSMYISPAFATISSDGGPRSRISQNHTEVEEEEESPNSPPLSLFTKTLK